MKAMRIADYGSSKNLKLVEVPAPKISPDEVLVSIKAAGINHIDSLKASGRIRHVYPLQLPWIPGADFAGKIHQVGKNVSRFKIGDAVFGSKAEGGAYAEFIAASPDTISQKPESLSYTEAASVPMVAETALMGLFKYGHLKSGQTILIHGGAGAVGAYAVQLAHQAGANVIVTARATHKEYLLGLGAHEVIDYNAQKFESVIQPVDMVFDLIGGDVQERSFAVVKPGGYLVATNQLPSIELAEKFKLNAVFMHAKPSFETLKQISALIDESKLKVNIAKLYPLQEAGLAWENIAMNMVRTPETKPSNSNRANGKHVLTMPDNHE